MSLFTVITRDNAYQLPSAKLIVGLGNIGEKYALTRHNIGFMALDYFAQEKDLPSFSVKKDLESTLSEGKIEDTKVLLAKPMTYMNRSGLAVIRLQNYFELGMDQILVIHDDIDLEFGDIRTKVGGGSGGHNGIKSIDNAIGEDYARIRVGVANENRQERDASDFVLSRFSTKEEEQLDDVFDDVCDYMMQFIDNQLTNNGN